MNESLLEAVKHGVLLADGAMGTELLRCGLEPGGFGEIWNLERPEAVISVHSAYCAAGARFLTTNSFRANRHTLASHHLDNRTCEINRQAARVAVEAAKGRAWVLGSMGPFGGFLEPLGNTSTAEAFSFFTEQARALIEGGADGIVVETMTAVEECEVAIRAARAAGAALVVAMMTFGRSKGGFRTMMGVTPEQAINAMTVAGTDIVGSNCGEGLSMEEYSDLVRIFRSLTAKPIIIRPNAGRPALIASEVKYEQTPERMASQVEDLVRAGANIVGGCCGTTPDHIRLFGQAMARQAQ